MTLDDQARERIRRAAVDFVDDAFGRLAMAQALPLPGRESPWIDRTRLWGVLGHAPGSLLSSVLEAELPDRFPFIGPMPRAEDYSIALLRGVVATATLAEIGNAPGRPDLVEELLRLVEAPDQSVRCIRLLSHIDVTAVAGATVAGVRLEPANDLETALSRELPEGVAEVDSVHALTGSKEPRALVIAEAVGPRDTWLLVRDIQPTLQYLATAVRLLTGATVSQVVQVYGQPTFVHASSPFAAILDHEPATYWRRVGTVSAGDLDGLHNLVRYFVELDAQPPRKLPSLIVAIGRFNRSFRPAAWQDLVVDLSIGLEATLSSPGERDSLTLALRSRAAHLLAMVDDPPDEIFRDIGELYDLRSAVVHGSLVPESEWTNLFNRRGIKQVLPNDRLEVAMDRWRDLLRRAILARLLLSDGRGPEAALWPLRGKQPSVDDQLVGPAGRHAWRRQIRDRAGAFGISRSWCRAEPLRDFLHDRWTDAST
jgi:Apea-like HEPN